MVPGGFSVKNYAYRVEFRVSVLVMLRVGAGRGYVVQGGAEVRYAFGWLSRITAD